MSYEQQSLEGFDPDPTPCRADNVHQTGSAARDSNLFLALTPADSAEASFLFEHSRRLREQFGISELRIQPASRLHATMPDLGGELGDDGLPAQTAVDGVIAALASMTLPAVPIRFTRVRGFEGGSAHAAKQSRRPSAVSSSAQHCHQTA